MPLDLKPMSSSYQFSSRYRGVAEVPGCKWEAQIGLGGRIVNLGSFDDEYEAGVMYARAFHRVHVMRPEDNPVARVAKNGGSSATTNGSGQGREGPEGEEEEGARRRVARATTAMTTAMKVATRTTTTTTTTRRRRRRRRRRKGRLERGW